MAAEEPRTESRDRIAFIDGLRGVAIGAVLLFHAWYHFAGAGAASGTLRLYGAVASRGAEGVSLFLVLSGFCLSYPLLRRRALGVDAWFVPSVFFARRTLRILPPYYVALGLCLVVIAVFSPRWMDAAPNTWNLVSHLTLLHNNTVYGSRIDGPFWSLGLEWQWYLVFPFVLLLAVRSRVLALAACLGVAVFWHLVMRDLGSHPLAPLLPQRLFEFCLGIVAAWLVLRSRIPPAWLLVLSVVFPLAAAELPLTQLATKAALGQLMPLSGISFAALLLLGYRSRVVQALLSWRPLVWLGTISYSVYLIHDPALSFVEESGLVPVGERSALVMVLAIPCSIMVGYLFHLAVERPCMHPGTRAVVEPVLARWYSGAARSFTALRRTRRPAPAPLPVPD